MLEPSRRHGHYDPRWSTSLTPPISTERPSVELDPESIGTWEGEGGSTPVPRFDSSARESVADGLTWETFGETFYPGKKHHLPAIHAWSLYCDGDRFWPRGALQRRKLASLPPRPATRRRLDQLMALLPVETEEGSREKATAQGRADAAVAFNAQDARAYGARDAETT